MPHSKSTTAAVPSSRTRSSRTRSRSTRSRRGAPDSRGLSNSTQWAVLFPVAMLATLGIIQAGVWVHGHNVAIEAANAAADASRGTSADVAAGRAAAQRVAAVGGLTDVDVQIVRGATQVDVTFTGRIPMFVDLGLSKISETAHAPAERLTQP